MVLDIGSRKRRVETLRKAVGKTALRPLEKIPGLIDALAEHRFSNFRDHRTPDSALLDPLMRAVESEYEAGRLVFDDLGALFWELLERFPRVERAYRARFAAVIADEHQDASALQDAIVRRFGQNRLVIFADPMQLIHGFRGATKERLDAHRNDSNELLSLSTPHRWHGNEHVGEWLLALRERLAGRQRHCSPPAELVVRCTRHEHGFNAVKAQVKYAVGSAFRDGHRSIAVLAATNSRVGALRKYLCRENFRPRQIGSADFEDARDEIEELRHLSDRRAIARRAIDTIEALVPTYSRAALKQARRRLQPSCVDLKKAGAEAQLLLEPIQDVYDEGGSRYFETVVKAVTAAQDQGHHVPRIEFFQALQRTADALAGHTPKLEEAIMHYAQYVSTMSHIAPRTDRGLFVMTAHQAKGKEFDCVILADATDKLFPDDFAGRCLFYVAITRASKRWEVVAPNKDATPHLSCLGVHWPPDPK
jgi:superfamily I DNA/RNA helicase